MRYMIPLLALSSLACAEAAPVHEAPAAHAEKAPASAPAKNAAKGSTPALRNDVDADGFVRRGEALSSAPAMTVAECAAKAAELDGKQVKVSGTVASVCKGKGCWMGIASDDKASAVRITFKDYGFFVPYSAIGQKATVEGVLKVKTLTEAEAKHLAKDGGKDPDKVTGPQQELQLISSALEIAPKS